MSREAKLVVDEMIAAMQTRPADFHISEHTFEDRKSGLEFWIANTSFDAGVYRPYKLSFGPVQSWRFHRALKAFKACRAASSLIAATKS